MWYENYEDIKIIKELYRCHYTRQEAAYHTGRSYQTICGIYRGLEVSEIKKYDRKQLSNWEGFKHAVNA